MFERFTDRARRVLVLAQEEARLLGHSFIGTEHILLGLLQEGDGVGARALESLGITIPVLRQKVEETIGMAATPPSGSPPFTPRAKKVLELALREAIQLGHSYIGTEHILLGLVREGEGVASAVLISLGAESEAVRQKVTQLMSGDSDEAYFRDTDTETSSTNPHCPQCQSGLAEFARFRTIAVPPGMASENIDAILIDVVYCSNCGVTLHTMGSERAAANQAMRQRKSPYRETSVPRQLPSLRQRPANIEPTGPPPDDEEAARAAIRQAFANMDEVDTEKGDIPSVEGSEGLGILREQRTEIARSRYGGQVPNVTVAFVVDAVWFVNDHEAVVTYTARITGSLNITLGGRPGRALLVDGEWKVARETFCEWARTGGVECPPREGQ